MVRPRMKPLIMETTVIDWVDEYVYDCIWATGVLGCMDGYVIFQKCLIVKVGTNQAFPAIQR